MRKLAVVGIGPGNYENMTIRADRALRECDVIVGYTVYVDLVKERYADGAEVAYGYDKLGRLATVLDENGHEIKFGWDEGVLRLAAAEAYGHKSGARDLRNVLRRRVEDPICTLLAGCPEQPPALIHAEEKDGEIVLVTA